MNRHQRGSALLMAMVVLAVLALLAAAAVTSTGQESSSASQFQKRETLSACAAAARGWLMSHFQTGAANAVDVLNVRGQVDMGRFLIRTGHLDWDGVGPFPPAIEIAQGSTSGSGFTDLTNTTLPATGSVGKRTYRAVATCLERETGAATEIEFEVLLAL